MVDLVGEERVAELALCVVDHRRTRTDVHRRHGINCMHGKRHRDEVATPTLDAEADPAREPGLMGATAKQHALRGASGTGCPGYPDRVVGRVRNAGLDSLGVESEHALYPCGRDRLMTL